MKASIAALVMAAASTAHAADFSVLPMRLAFEPGQRTAEIRIKNHDAKPVRFQVAATDCDSAGDICTAASRALLAYPRALELAPDEARIVRVGVRGLSAVPRKFAVQIREVRLAEQPQPVNDGGKPGARIDFLVNIFVGVTVPGAHARQ